MTTETITLELPESLYRSAHQIAQATKRPLADVVADSLAHTLPPLDDISPEEAQSLALMSSMDDAALWREAEAMLLPEEAAELQALLDQQSTGTLKGREAGRLRALMDEYGRLLVRKSHAWLLLARRGYKVPVQEQK